MLRSLAEPKASLQAAGPGVRVCVQGGDKKAKEHEAARSVYEAVLSHSILSFTVALKHG